MDARELTIIVGRHADDIEDIQKKIGIFFPLWKSTMLGFPIYLLKLQCLKTMLKDYKELVQHLTCVR